MPKIIEITENLAPLIVTMFLVVVTLLALNWALLRRQKSLSNDQKLFRQMTLVALALCGLFAVVIALPISIELRNQLIAVIGIIFSGVLAFSSSTLVTNFIAGMILRMTKPFHTGDFIQVKDHFGRVSERGLLDTEIQTEYRELVSLPNSFLILNPVSTIRGDGTIISANLSLGYDVNHLKIEQLLIQAAEAAGLKEPFVQIIALGDFSVSYRVSGLLLEVKSLLTMRSNLFRHILDTMHNNAVEIVSPTFMNQRQVGQSGPFIPAPERIARPEDTNPELIMFDKANKAERREKLIAKLKSDIDLMEQLVKAADGEEEKQMKEMLGRWQNEVTRLESSEAL